MAGTKDGERRSAFHHRAPDGGTKDGERRSASRAFIGRVCCACVARVLARGEGRDNFGKTSGKLEENFSVNACKNSIFRFYFPFSGKMRGLFPGISGTKSIFPGG